MRALPVMTRVLALALLASMGWPLRAAAPHAVDVLAWAPGMARAQVEAQLGAARVRPIRRGSSALLLETPLFRSLFARQRALVEFDSADRLVSLTVHFQPSRDGAGEELLALYDDVRELFLGQLGSPSWSREVGAVSPGQALRVLADGSVMRCMQWESSGETHAEGGGGAPMRIVRLGIPKTASSQRRVEMRLVGTALPTPDGVWGREF